MGITIANADVLRRELLDAARNGDAMRVGENPIGVLYRIDFPMAGPSGTSVVRSGWIVHHNEDFARLTTCHVLS